MRPWVFGFEGINLLLLVVALFMLALPAHAQDTTAALAAAGSQNRFLGAAIATGLAAIGSGIAVGVAGAAAIGAIAEKPELLGRTLIFVGLAEGIVIYGLIVSFIILRG
jgi:V/A-type H+/Na+-transporting ATPase subunit K